MTPAGAGRLVILADDLTGALDSACEFASEAAPVAVGWSGRPPATDRMAYSTESRDVSAAQAAALVRRAARSVRTRDALCFKKIDSVLRGHPVDELAAWLALGDFQVAIVAPAFADQGRLTVAGRQRMRSPEGAWVPVGPDLVAAMRSRGLPAFRSPPSARPGRKVGRPFTLVADAGAQGDLDRLVRRLAGRRRGPLLWCGTGGLAHALGGGGPSPAVPPVELVVAGTGHPVTLAQIGRLKAAGVGALVLRGQPLADPARHGTVLLVADPDAPTADTAIRRLRASLESLRLWAPRPALVTGGETLRQFCDAVGAGGLSCVGRLRPGVAVARLQRGAWSGTTVVGKSGGFGDADLFVDLTAPARPGG
ncbi:MAG: four-carbon acid sugar kinase family protein [Inquilinaceae bacterium]